MVYVLYEIGVIRAVEVCRGSSVAAVAAGSLLG